LYDNGKEEEEEVVRVVVDSRIMPKHETGAEK
jgi:hypothetical protein